MCRNKIFFFLFISVLICLFGSLVPFSDIDNDGLLDSLVTEGFLQIPLLYFVTGLFLLLLRLVPGCLCSSLSCFSRVIPPF